ncbi:signal peptidase II [Cohnella laeviribosi]|uniref:signal peptidase II n=1 Tax=Cohnella laeviribosi TaxID=380174 RepID=UPI00036F2198
MLRYYILAIFVLMADQVTKWAVSTYMDMEETIPLIPNVFHLTSHRNRGAAFGILQNQRVFFIVVTIIIVIGIIVYLRKVYREQKFLSFGLSFVLGGALGNFVDRAIKGEVVDMLDFRLIDYPIFNLADCFIVTGVAIIILHTFLEARIEKKRNSN